MVLHPHPHFPGPHVPEPCIYCLRATGEAREARRGFACCPKQGCISIPLCLSGPLFLLGGKRAGSPLLLMEPPPAASASGRAGCGSTSCSPSHCLMLLNLSTSSFSSATRLSRSFTWSHQTPLLSLLSSGTSARLRHSLQPETWTAVRDLCLGPHAPSGDGFPASGNHS